MQTLRVGAGRTDKEYKEAQEQRRAALLADSRSDANYFFWAAGLSAVDQRIVSVRFNILVNVGAFDLLGFYGRRFLETRPLAGNGVVGAWMVAFSGAGICCPSRTSLGVPGWHGAVRG
jgi:hypothetical protein